MQPDLHHFGVLKTKLHCPALPTDVIGRGNLVHQLSQAEGFGFTLLCAPAGFGKSTLLSAWLKQSRLPNGWLSLDAGDNDLVVFLQYFITAIQGIYPSACAATLALCKSATTTLPAELTSSLINEMDLLPGEFVLVLDDYHSIENEDIHQLIRAMILRPPRTLHLVMSSRQDPPLPLAKLRAQGKMLELRTTDLRFGRDEAAAFFAQILDHPLEDGTLAVLEQHIEGWPVGLRLAALSLRRAGSSQDLLAALTQWRGHAVDFLFNDVFSFIPPAKQECLLKLSVLERFCPELASALCAPDEEPRPAAFDGKHFLAWLEEANLFLIALDEAGQWFRFHVFFLEMLRRRSRAFLQDAQRAELHRRASHWFAGAGMVDEALDHAIQAGDMDGACTLISHARYTVINSEQWSRFGRWLSLLPVERIHQSLSLLIGQAWILHHEFRLGQLGALLGEIAVLREGSSTSSSEAELALADAEIATLRSVIDCWSTRADEAVRFARDALDKAPPSYSFLRGNAYLYYCFGMQMSGNMAEGVGLLQRALELDPSGKGTQTTRMLIAVAGSYWLAGDSLNTLRFGRQILEVAQRQHLMTSRSWACMLVSFAHYQRNELDAAAACCSSLIDHPIGAHPMALGHTMLVMALVHQAQNRPTEALAFIEKAYTLAFENGVAALRRQTEAVQARLHLANDEIAPAVQWADLASGERLSIMPVFLDLPELTLARVRLQQCTPASLAQATGVLDEARRFIERTHNSLHEAELLAIEALVYAASGLKNKAHTQLARALVLAEPGSMVRLFVDLGPNMAALLRELAEQKYAPAYARRVLGDFSGDPLQMAPPIVHAHVAEAALIEQLTDRELEVLALLGERLSNKEIAELLVLSPHTVKTHMRNIFAKLQVSRRREAIARARSLGLFGIK